MLNKKCSIVNMPNFITHQDTNSFTNEGLGSHARGSVYPLLNIALVTGLKPVLNNETFWSNSGRNYKDINFATFFNINEKIPDGYIVIEIDTWKAAFGRTEVLIETILNLTLDSKPTYLIVLSGPLRYVSPSSEVLSWFQTKCSKWHVNGNVTMAVHIRRGDMDVNMNQIDWFINAIKTVNEIVPQITTNIVSEENFSVEEESEIRNQFPWVTLSRGGTDTILNDLKTLAAAKILIGSKSYFSALAGYLGPEDGIIIVDDGNNYFQTHNEIRNNVYTLNSETLLEKLCTL